MNSLPIPPKCPTCDGQGLIVRVVRCTLYRTGTKTEAYPCPACVGTGKLLPVVDAKTLACGEVA